MAAALGTGRQPAPSCHIISQDDDQKVKKTNTSTPTPLAHDQARCFKKDPEHRDEEVIKHAMHEIKQRGGIFSSMLQGYLYEMVCPIFLSRRPSQAVSSPPQNPYPPNNPHIAHTFLFDLPVLGF